MTNFDVNKNKKLFHSPEPELKRGNNKLKFSSLEIKLKELLQIYDLIARDILILTFSLTLYANLFYIFFSHIWISPFKSPCPGVCVFTMGLLRITVV